MSIHAASNGHTHEANDTHEMETDDKELPEDLLVDDVTMIAEAEETDYKSG